MLPTTDITFRSIAHFTECDVWPFSAVTGPRVLGTSCWRWSAESWHCDLLKHCDGGAGGADDHRDNVKQAGPPVHSEGIAIVAKHRRERDYRSEGGDSIRQVRACQALFFSLCSAGWVGPVVIGNLRGFRRHISLSSMNSYDVFWFAQAVANTRTKLQHITSDASCAYNIKDPKLARKAISLSRVIYVCWYTGFNQVFTPRIWSLG